ncbi:Hypothetical protein ING2D1G_0147 [Peptoniphilus sp. ING2-D1G]|nr:Hypothetical protein ING2D1G_0147 [Peptoniphilus sp. ING2-D1G]
MPKSAINRVYEGVKKDIIINKLKPGTTITESSMCEKFKVGRSSVRNAFSALIKDGYLESEPNKSVRVAFFTLEQIRQLYSLRRTLEMYALKQTINFYNSEDFLFLENSLVVQKKSFEEGDFNEYLESINDFRKYIIKKANNPYLNVSYDYIMKKISVYLTIYDNFLSVETLKSLPNYKKTLEGIKNKDLDMIEHYLFKLEKGMLEAYSFTTLL